MEQQYATTQKPRQEPKKRQNDTWLIIGLIVLSVVPALGGIVRLSGLANQTSENTRFFASPLPIVIHIAASLVFCLIGAFQFAPSFRKRYPQWHRMAGRWLMVAGLASAISGLWMTVFYTIPQPLQGSILYFVRLLVGFGMVLCIVFAWKTIIHKKIAAHQAWITRAYALGQGAGTQVVVTLPYIGLFGQPNQLARDLLMTAAWVINLLIVEWSLLPKTTLSKSSSQNSSVSQNK